MSVSSISTAAVSQYQPRNGQQADTKTDFRQLAQAIKSGDLTSAQSAFDSLTSALQGSSGSNTSTSGSNASNPFQQVLDQIGQSLSNNDINGAQQALSAFQTSSKGMHHHRHHGGGDTAQQAAAQTTASNSKTVSAETGVNLVV